MSDTVLVTGGAGFIGSHTAAYYAQGDSEVIVFDNRSRGETLESVDKSRDSARHNWRYLEQTYPSSIEFVHGDIRNYEAVESVVDRADKIVHTAGQVAVTSSLENPVLDFETNAQGTLNVLEATRQSDSDPSLVFASTNKVYGNNVNALDVVERERRYEYEDPEYRTGIPETFPIDDTEHTPYGVSKLAADLYVQDYARRDLVDAAVFRMSCIYGDRQFGSEDQGWVAHFAISVLEDEPLTIFGDGKQVRDVLHVSDLVRAYDAFLSDPTGKPVVYNMGGGPDHTTSLLEFLDLLEDEIGHRPDVSFEDWREGDQRVYVSDIERARAALDWEPQVGFDDGIGEFIDWYRESDYLGGR